MNNKKYWKPIFRFLKEKDYFRVLCKQLLNYSAVYDKQYPNLSYFEHISHSVLISWFKTYGISMSQGHVKDIHRVDIIKDLVMIYLLTPSTDFSIHTDFSAF